MSHFGLNIVFQMCCRQIVICYKFTSFLQFFLNIYKVRKLSYFESCTIQL